MRGVHVSDTAEKNLETFNEPTCYPTVLGFMGFSTRKQAASDEGRPVLSVHAASVRQMREARGGRLLSRVLSPIVASRALWSVTTSLVLALLLLPMNQGLASQLPPHIQADLYLMQAEENIEKQDFAAAKEALDRILDLQKEHGLTIPEAFYFRHAEVAARVGLYKEAVESVTRYLTMAGRDGEHYKDALELLNASQAETFSADRACEGKSKGSECWMELINQPECYVWNAYLHPGKTVTWTGECAGGLAQGTGTLKWVWQSDPKLRDESPSPSRAEPQCAGQPKGTACWMELTKQPECYVWNPNPQPNETVTWTGECSSGLTQGTGTLTWIVSDQKTEEGEGRLQDGKTHGQWVWRNSDGSTRERFYVDGEYVGPTAEAEEMEGRVVGGKPHGDWVYRLANGTLHKGPYVKGKRHGEWSIQLADDDGKLSGTVEEGPYVDGEKYGQWVFRHENGNIEERPYKNGKLHGQVTGRAVDGQTWEVSFVNGKRDGLFITRFADGSVNNKGLYMEGKKHGRWNEQYFEGGPAHEGQYVDGKRHGQWVTRDEEGNILGEQYYAEGEKHGRWIERNEEGKVTERGQYEHGKRHGEWSVDYGGDGWVDEKGSYVEGEKHGRWTEVDYYDSHDEHTDRARVVLEGEYESGKRVGRWSERFDDGCTGAGEYAKPEKPEDYGEGGYTEWEYYNKWHRHGHWVVEGRNKQSGVNFREEGPYVYGERHGQWKRAWRGNDRVDEGQYQNGERVGYWIFRFPSGWFWEGPFVDGKQHGEWIQRKKVGGGIKGRRTFRYGRKVE